jgi:hypothetical protein
MQYQVIVSNAKISDFGPPFVKGGAPQGGGLFPEQPVKLYRFAMAFTPENIVPGGVQKESDAFLRHLRVVCPQIPDLSLNMRSMSSRDMPFAII